jgi:pyruvate/2-oxoglutarate dehydrogenase complex dihydrolipoamide dehydrogenase (E3) component
MSQSIDTDLCIIGAGSGGLSVAAAASQMGIGTVLLERSEMGGDCLNSGCVPSKALIAASRAVSDARHASVFGVTADPVVDFGKVHRHVHDVIASIAPQDSVPRFTALGVTVLRESGAFVSPREVDAGGTRIRARRFVIATGSSPAVPPIEGLAGVPFLTNETIFNLETLPRHLIIVGGGPIGVELAQAFRNLGARVTIVEMFAVLGREDPEFASVVRRQLDADGVTILDKAKIERVDGDAGRVTVRIVRDGEAVAVEGSHLLVAAGRRPNVDGLGLEAAGIRYSAKGIDLDRGLRTTNRRVYAVGDVAGGPQFTHVAGYHAGLIVRSALFRLPAKADYRAMPRATYTSPEIAQVGLMETEARDRYPKVRILRWPFSENDRAHAERRPHGLVKVIVTPRGRILGAGIVGDRAGDLIQPWTLAISRKLKIGAMAEAVAAYPTLGEVSKRAAGSFFVPTLFGDRVRRLVGLLKRLP